LGLSSHFSNINTVVCPSWTYAVQGNNFIQCCTKLFESVLVKIFADSLRTDELQFGFKKCSSYSHAIFTFNETVKYFTKQGTKIHCAAFDAFKMFNKVYTLIFSVKC